jgi:hypothetical protein
MGAGDEVSQRHFMRRWSHDGMRSIRRMTAAHDFRPEFASQVDEACLWCREPGDLLMTDIRRHSRVSTCIAAADAWADA